MESSLSGPKRSPKRDLTQAEKLVAREVALSKSNKEIAHDLRITQATVEKHIQHTMEKLHCPNRVGVAFAAVEAGLVTLEEALKPR